MLTIGADPELFLKDKSGQYKSSIGLIGGSKEVPFPLGRQGCAVQEDNVAVEFNIPPASHMRSFVDSIQYGMDEIKKIVPDLELAIEATAEFPEAELQTPEAKVFGCDPDFNAWTRSKNPRPRSMNPQLRSAGGHVHFGYTAELAKDKLIKACDLFMGVPSVLMDGDARRRELYGKAGAFRPTSYGVEYRVLSNFWLKDKKLIEWAWNTAVQSYYQAIARPDAFFDLMQDRIVSCINSSDTNEAMKLVREFELQTV